MYMSIKIFYHIYCNNSTEKVVHDQLTKLMFSGLYHTANELHCFLTGEWNIMERVETLIHTFGDKYKITKKVANDTTYERFTLSEISSMIVPEDKILYFHTKGITKPTNHNVYDWRTYMEFFLMSRHQECLQLLDHYDTVGVNVANVPALHYSGNFWWCRGDYFLKLDVAALDHLYDGGTYFAPEMWIGTQQPRTFQFFNTGRKNLYDVALPPVEYVRFPLDPTLGGTYGKGT